jgi:hypothetical protein
VTPSDLVNQAPLTQEMKESALLILQRFNAAGLSSGIALGAVVNAYAESQLDPLVCFGRTPWGPDRAFGPIDSEENSCGLFQLNAAKNALGAGMSVEARQNANLNIGRVIEEVKGPGGTALRLASADNAPLGRLVYLFTVDIEKPQAAEHKGDTRAELARSWWPDLVDVSSSQLPQFSKTNSGFFFAALASLLVAVVVFSR